MNMRRRMRQMQEEMQAFVDYVQKEFVGRTEQPREGARTPWCASLRVQHHAHPKRKGLRSKGKG